MNIHKVKNHLRKFFDYLCKVDEPENNEELKMMLQGLIKEASILASREAGGKCEFKKK